MKRFSPMLRMLWFAGLVCHSLPSAAQAPLFPGFTTTPTSVVFPGITASPISTTPLSGSPPVLSLDHLDPAQMSAADDELVSHLGPELSKQAALANFDISQPAWHYQQIVCPAFPDYVFLAFSHGADEEGSSRFAALLPRGSAEVRVVSTYAHGLLPFNASWNRPGTFEVFNNMLRAERGSRPLSEAPNWLMIAICYAELSGYAVQVVSYSPQPNTSLDLLRLGADRAQMVIGSDQSAEVTFSDVSRPEKTTNWRLHFDRRGQITSADHEVLRQAENIALKP